MAIFPICKELYKKGEALGMGYRAQDIHGYRWILSDIHADGDWRGIDLFFRSRSGEERTKVNIPLETDLEEAQRQIQAHLKEQTYSILREKTTLDMTASITATPKEG